MKTYKNLIAVYILFSMLIFSGCKDPAPSPIEERTTLLVNGGSPWALGSVVKDGFDVTDQFTGFTITFDATTYATTNSLNTAWAPSGSWTFKGSNPDIMIREDGIEVNIAATANQIVLSFISAGPIGGRVDGVSGEYVFTLTNL